MTQTGMYARKKTTKISEREAKHAETESERNSKTQRGRKEGGEKYYFPERSHRHKCLSRDLSSEMRLTLNLPTGVRWAGD